MRDIVKVKHMHASNLSDALAGGMASLRRETNAVTGWLPMADKILSDGVYEERLETMKKLIACRDSETGE